MKNTEAKHEPTFDLPADYRGGFVVLECTICHRNVRVIGGTPRGHYATPKATLAARIAASRAR